MPSPREVSLEKNRMNCHDPNMTPLEFPRCSVVVGLFVEEGGRSEALRCGLSTMRSDRRKDGGPLLLQLWDHRRGMHDFTGTNAGATCSIPKLACATQQPPCDNVFTSENDCDRHCKGKAFEPMATKYSLHKQCVCLHAEIGLSITDKQNDVVSVCSCLCAWLRILRHWR